MDYLERAGSEQPSSKNIPSLDEFDYWEGITEYDGWEKTISRQQLINQLNYVNFQNGSVVINFKHSKYDRIVSHKVTPQPCVTDYLVCLWQESQKVEKLISDYRFHSLFVPNGTKLFTVKTELRRLTAKGICILLPETCTESNIRKTKRHPCDHLKVQLIQNSVFFPGMLLDFNAVSFRVRLTAKPPQTFQWINTKARVNIIFANGTETLYSGECRIINQTTGNTSRDFILEPLNQVIQRYKPKEYRSSRLSLKPTPDMLFRHPFTRRLVTLKVIDISGSGFSVEDNRDTTVLLAGMIIPDAHITFANSFKIQCRAQVVYRKKIPGEDGHAEKIKCGLALLDMQLEDHRKLLALLQQAENKNSYVCNQVDLDALWNFFFETGFLYPKKYIHLQANKARIKETYRKLYTGSNNISRHFIYQEKGEIRGHMSMLRFYENTWLIHHHAARSTSLLQAGLIVLDQIGQFTYDSHRLHSSHMDYLICYYRPENKFPQYVFGGAAESTDNPKGCSVDTFAYFHTRRCLNGSRELPPEWTLAKTQPEDLLELESVYENMSGGLMLDALDLAPGATDRYEITEEFKAIDLTRERRLFSLKREDRLKAVIMLNMTDIALNMSDLTNCINVFMIDQEDATRKIVTSVLAQLSGKFSPEKVPVLLFPVSFADDQQIPYEKRYNLWILNTQYSDHYFNFIDQLKNARVSREKSEGKK